jgi:flagellar assembly protein FliH
MMADGKSKQNIIHSASEDEFSHWQLPDVTQAGTERPDNLFGHKGRATYGPDVKESVAPPTMAEIEAIRAEAEAEGLEEGRQQGYREGLEQGKLEGLAQGHQSGLEQGKQQGYEEGLADAKNLVARFESLMLQFDKPLTLLDTEIELALLELSMTLAKAVVGNELKSHPEHILAALRHGIDALPVKEQAVTIRVNPKDAELIQQVYSCAQLEKHQWRLDEDPLLAQGDCILSSQRSEVDLRLGARLEAIFAELNQQQAYLTQQVTQQRQALAAEAAGAQAEIGSDSEGLDDLPDSSEETDAQSSPPTAE